MNQDRKDDEIRPFADGGDEVALWQRARAGLFGAEPPGDAVDPMLIAAYLDGSLDDAEKAALESRLLRDPEGLDLLIASRQALDEGPAAHVPEAVFDRAEALVRAAPAGSDGLFHRVGAWLAAAETASPAAAWSAAVASFVLACVVGFALGESSYESLATIAKVLSSETGLGLDASAGLML